MSVFVIDASVTLPLNFEDESSPYADAVAESLEGNRALAPVVWPLEVANAILTAARRGRIPDADVPFLFGATERFRVELDQGRDPGHLAQLALSLGAVHRVSAYDASYLELALWRGVSLATLDQRLRRAASAAGVSLYQP